MTTPEPPLEPNLNAGYPPAPPETAGKVAGNLASGKVLEEILEAFNVIKDAPLPLKLVAVITPATVAFWRTTVPVDVIPAASIWVNAIMVF